MSTATTTLEHRPQSPGQAEELLGRALAGRGGRLTKADAVTATGLEPTEVDGALERLSTKYRSRLEVTEDGELLYSFGKSMIRRDAPSLMERLQKLGHALALAGTWLFKAWIAVTLIAYLIGFVVLLIAMMFSGGDRDRDRRGPDLGWLWWYLLPNWGWGPSYYEPPPRRYSRSFQPEQPKKKIFDVVFDFVFGPKPTAVDAKAEERRVLGYIRAHDGRITATDLVALLGSSYREAEEEALRLLSAYNGDVEVTDEGVLIYEFPKLLKTAGELAPTTRTAMAWDRLETAPSLTGNSTGANVAIAAFAGFNLMMSTVATRWVTLRFGAPGPELGFLLGAFPLAFFALFLSIPGLRVLFERLRQRGRERRNQRRRALKKLFDQGGAAVTAEPALTALLAPLEGEPEVAPDGEIKLSFPRIGEERKALAKHLEGVDVAGEKRIGPVIFGNDEEIN